MVLHHPRREGNRQAAGNGARNGPVDAGSVTIRNFARTEKTVPVATVRIDKKATARCLTVRDCRMANGLDERIPFIENLGKVEVLTRENNDFAGEWKSLGERMCESRRFTSRAVASRAE